MYKVVIIHNYFSRTLTKTIRIHEPVSFLLTWVSCISVGSNGKFEVFSTQPYSKLFSLPVGSVSICEMLFSTSLVIVVGSADQVRCVKEFGHLFGRRLPFPHEKYQFSMLAPNSLFQSAS